MSILRLEIFVEHTVHFVNITTIYKELVVTLSATAFVAQLVKCYTRLAESRIRFPAGGIGVVFFATVPG